MCEYVFCLLAWRPFARGEEQRNDYYNNERQEVVTSVIWSECVCGWMCAYVQETINQLVSNSRAPGLGR